MTIKNLITDCLKKTSLPMFIRELYTICSPRLRQTRKNEEADLAYIAARVGSLLQQPLYPAGGPTKTVLIMGMGRVRFIAQESLIRKAFELAGYRCVIIVPQDREVVKAYQALGNHELLFLGQHFTKPNSKASQLLEQYPTLAALTSLIANGVRCGKYAASTLMRKTRSGMFDLSQPAIRQEMIKALDRSLRCAETAESVINRIAPNALVLVDRGYSPSGEFFDCCIAKNIPVITWNAAHKNNTLMLKRYTAANRDVHPSSLSSKTWQAMQGMPWTPQHWQALKQELEHCYGSGEWYAEVGTQFNKKPLNKEELTAKLGIDPTKKTAVIFPHIFWDATFFWGDDLFENYEDWFMQTVQAACRNDHLNWIIKVHPANLVKDKRDGVSGEHSEITAIRKAVGTLPPHVKLLSANTDISTLSLFSIMDCCVTVRGTVGIEAACFGIPVLTAGTGRFDHLGFTLDSDSREEYLTRLAAVQHLTPLDTQQTELARRYAYGFLLCRPTQLQAMEMHYCQNATAELEVEYTAKTIGDLQRATDINRIAQWLNSGDEDYLQLPE